MQDLGRTKRGDLRGLGGNKTQETKNSTGVKGVGRHQYKLVMKDKGWGKARRRVRSKARSGWRLGV